MTEYIHIEHFSLASAIKMQHKAYNIEKNTNIAIEKQIYCNTFISILLQLKKTIQYKLNNIFIHQSLKRSITKIKNDSLIGKKFIFVKFETNTNDKNHNRYKTILATNFIDLIPNDLLEIYYLGNDGSFILLINNIQRIAFSADFLDLIIVHRY